MKPTLLLLIAVLVACGSVFTWAQTPVAHLDIYSGPNTSFEDPALLAHFSAEGARRGEAIVLREQAKEAIKKGESSSAVSLLKQALSNDPTEQEACILLTYFYIQKGQPEDVIATLNPIVDPPGDASVSIGNDITTRMIYILALLDQNAWHEAAACYEKTWRLEPARAHKWFLPGDGIDHAWPNPQFRSEVPDYAGLRAQAHLILGSRPPLFMEEKDQFPRMLEHLSHVLQINPASLDATFLSGWTLGKMDRFAEARAAFASAAQLGSPAVQKEIKEELVKLNTREETKRAEEVQKAAKQAKLK